MTFEDTETLVELARVLRTRTIHGPLRWEDITGPSINTPVYMTTTKLGSRIKYDPQGGRFELTPYDNRHLSWTGIFDLDQHNAVFPLLTMAIEEQLAPAREAHANKVIGAMLDEMNGRLALTPVSEPRWRFWRRRR